MREDGRCCLLFYFLILLTVVNGTNTTTYQETECPCCDGSIALCFVNMTEFNKDNETAAAKGTNCTSFVSYSIEMITTKTDPKDLISFTVVMECSTTTTTTTVDPKATTTTTDPLVTVVATVAGQLTSTTTDNSATTNTTECEDLNDNGICDIYEAMRCETKYLTGNDFTIAKILCYVATIWVILWCIITIIVNIAHKNSGHHRWIHLFEELGIIVLWIFMGILNLTMRDNASGFCSIISIVIHYFIVFVSACFLFEAIFANSMVHNKKKKNGSIPPFLNYIFPIILALIPCLVTYFLKKDYYGATGLHCFVFVPLEIMYGFVIPVWLLLIFATLKAALGNLACDKTSEEQDEKQCYWAKKSCKMLSFLAYWIFMAYLTCMFGSSNQLLWVLIIFLIQSLILGPLIFVVHTYGHLNTAKKWYKPSGFGKFYSPCAIVIPPLFTQPPPPPPPPPPPASPPPEEEPKRKPKRKSSPPPRRYDSPPRTKPMPPPPSELNTDQGHMRAQDLWGWATTKGQKDDALFRPRPM